MHKGRTVDAYKVWKRIRGIDTLDAREEFFVMKVSTEEEEAEVARGRTSKYPWMDFITKPRARRAIIYANIMIFLGQFTGINAIMWVHHFALRRVSADLFPSRLPNIVITLTLLGTLCQV